MSHYTIMLYAIGAAAVFAFVQMLYTKQAKPDLWIMAITGALFIGSGGATHILLADVSA